MKFKILIFLSLFLLNNTLAEDMPGNLAKDKEKIYSYLNLATSFKESGEYEKAEEVLSKIKDLDDDSEILQYLARLNYLSGKNQEALKILSGLKKGWLDFLYLGLIYEDLDNQIKAINSYQKSLKLKPNSISLFRLGKIYRKQSNYKKAIDYFLELIRLDPSIRLSYYYLGECFYKINQYEQSYKFLAKALGFYPTYLPLKTYLAAVKKELGEGFFAAAQREKEKEREKIKLASYQIEKNIPLIKIALAKELDGFSFSCGGKFTIEDNGNIFSGEPDKFYTIVLKKGRIFLKDRNFTSGYKELGNNSITISSLGLKDKRYPFCILSVTYGKSNFWHKKADRIYRGTLEVVVKNNKLAIYNNLNVEEYLYGVLSAEMPADSPLEALKAQAIAARTIAIRNMGRHRKEGFDFCADVHCQVYQGLSAETPSTNEAVRSTHSEVITYNSKVIEAFYHANSGGCLSSDVFGQSEYLTNTIDAKKGKLPVSSYQEELWFLNSPDTFSSYDFQDKFRWQRVYDTEDMSIALSPQISKLQSILPKEKRECFRYREIDIVTADSKKTLKGDLQIREYFDQLKSSAFKVEIKFSSQHKPKLLIFWGGGFGHGAGMSQQGAVKMAKDGYSYKEILKHYYPGTEIERKY
ncbi:MAG: SpoIID/LytB domain-containing protein [Candidatus Omnitrophica bacterium]|jgi:SpoIID/LytB domain protein|nr:SpoIID/LytB domain-containing protein [Candidatus Omnitrophota bacterium]